ncbi:molybdate ABC transporter substrate-binding protein [bacterium]|nr:molybdate ABC transporter substrate-binding protein [bacterium]
MKIFVCVALVLIAMSAYAAEIQVYAAASLTDALTEIGEQYRKQTGDQLVFNFAASSVLARQIEEGAPADIFFSADEAKMDSLQKKKLIVPETRKSLLSNILVIVVPEDSKLKLSSAKDLLNVKGYIAIAEPKTVPAGIYAKEYLNKIGIWSKIIDHLVPTENVRAALLAVELGNADAGIVYKTDAEISKKTKVGFEVPVQEGPKIGYPVAVVSESKNIEAARKALSYIESENALEIFKKYKFLTQQ